MGTPAKKWEICIQSLFVRFNRLTIMSIIITTNDKVPTLKKKVIQKRQQLNIDQDEIVNYIVKEAKKDGMGPYDPNDVFFVVQGEMEYGNSLGQVD